MTKDVISLSISVLLLFRHYISHKITFGAPSSGGVLCSACGAFIKMSLMISFWIEILHMHIIYTRLIYNCMFEHLILENKSGISCKIK